MLEEPADSVSSGIDRRTALKRVAAAAVAGGAAWGGPTVTRFVSIAGADPAESCRATTDFASSTYDSASCCGGNCLRGCTGVGGCGSCSTGALSAFTFTSAGVTITCTPSVTLDDGGGDDDNHTGTMTITGFDPLKQQCYLYNLNVTRSRGIASRAPINTATTTNLAWSFKNSNPTFSGSNAMAMVFTVRCICV